KGKVSLLATNMEMGVFTEFEAEVASPGKTTVSARNIYEICKELPTGSIEMELIDNLLKIKSGRVDFKIPTLPASDFPKVPLPSAKPNLEIESARLKNMIDKVTFCASSDETKYHLNSVYFDNGTDKGTLRMVSTDGHRLGLMDSNICTLADLGAVKGILFPKKGIMELRKIMDASDKVSLMLESGYLYVYIENSLLFIKQMELEYPDYMRVVPKGPEKALSVKRTDMLSALKRVSLVTTIKSKTVLVSLNDNSMSLSSRSPDFGEAVEEIEASYNDENMEIRFNSKYLVDILSALDDDILNFNIGDPLSPVLVKPQKDESAYLYVVMPMRI
ncbi:MAG: DNA polymerase III subunit beta, partial [Oligoflexia bacterium]|nr:DNA polymerase III subunit beta [Oligoflexia bacterium]